jgi:hypothetical protein
MAEPRSEPAKWHRTLARVAGELSLCIARRKIGKEQAKAWLAALDQVRKELDVFLGGR